MVLEAAAASIGIASINKLVEKIIIPKVENIAKKMSLKYDEIMIPRGEHFEEYFNRTYRLYNTTTIALRNSKTSLKDIYIPLTITTNNSSHINNEILLDRYPVDKLKEYTKILITDTAGMGKSTLSKRLFLDVIDNGYGIPIFIETRRLSSEKNIKKLILEQISSLTKDFNEDLLLLLINSGGFIFFFDGFDEIPFKEREFVTKDIQDFISKAGNETNTFILTSRPEQALASFGDFFEFKIRPLKENEAHELIIKYDNNGECSELLINKLKAPEYSSIKEFLQTPLLVSLLFISFEYKHTIPLKKNVFYRQVFDAYYNSHDLTKGGGYSHEKKSKLGIDEFDKVLRYLGFECLINGKVEFVKDEIIHILENVKDKCGINSFNISDFFEDILSAVPLFCRDGIYFKWVHKSLQEYFAAMFIYNDCKDRDKMIESIYNSKKLSSYLNTLDIFYHIDKETFRHIILKGILSDFILFYDSMTDKYNKEISQDLINERIGLLFYRDIYYGINNVDFHEIHFDHTFDKIREKFIKGHFETELCVSFGEPTFSTAINIKIQYHILSIIFNHNKHLYVPIKHNTSKIINDLIIDLEPRNENLINCTDQTLIHNQSEYFESINIEISSKWLNINKVKEELRIIEKEINDKKTKFDDLFKYI